MTAPVTDIPPVIDIVEMSDAWTGAGLSSTDLDDLARRAVDAARVELGSCAGRCGPSARMAAIVFADDALIQRLNRDHRGADRPTNVLAFPAVSPAGLGSGTSQPEEIGAPAETSHAHLRPHEEMSLGDVVLALETIAREATEYGLSIHDRAAHMIIHGYLHLHGYDHQTEDDAEEMESMERRSLARLGLADPYGARANA